MSVARTFGLAFLWSWGGLLALGWSLQLWILPTVFPERTAEYGMLAERDSLTFHWAAVGQAERIKEEGWSAWTLRADEFLDLQPAGLASAVYAVTVPRPWVLVPFQAAIHAGTFVLLAWMLGPLVPGPRWALLAAMPFLIFPSAANWWAQIHRDGIFILGFLVAWAGLLLLAGRRGPRTWWVSPCLGAALVLVGGGLVYLMRPYGLFLLTASLLAASLIAIPLGREWKRGGLRWLGLGGICVVLLLFAEGKGDWSERVPDSMPIRADASTPVPGSRVEDAPAPAGVPSRTVQQPSEESFFALGPLDWGAQKLSASRRSFLLQHPEDQSHLDPEVRFHHFVDWIAYAPRAMAIGLFAPFPSHWESPLAGNPERGIASFEMVVGYGLLLGIVFLRWRDPRDLRLALLLLVASLVPLLLLASAVPNLGALYRMRFGFWQTWACVGACGWIVLLTRTSLARTKRGA